VGGGKGVAPYGLIKHKN